MIPIVIISYNNYKYVENTIQQINKANPSYLKDIVIIDNSSTDPQTITYLHNSTHKIIRNKNNGPWIARHCNAHIYDALPDKFILTDPDLEFNKNLPYNFIHQMARLSDKYKCYKLGFALDISDKENMYETKYAYGNTISEWEQQFWRIPIPDPTYLLYNATIDTTFCLINKAHHNSLNIRIANEFTAKHLPWYKENAVYTIHDQHRLNVKQETSISTTSKNILSHIVSNYLQIPKLDEVLFIENNPKDANLSFWKDIYPNWEADTFAIFQKTLHPTKYMIDIGGWIGTTCIYGARKSKHVFVVEADTASICDLKRNCKHNSDNITIIEKAIFNKSHESMMFGKNRFNSNAKLNDSTSQLYPPSAPTSSDLYSVETITIFDILKTHAIAANEISLIKVDIEGGEEYILEQLFALHQDFRVPLYISFHHGWWSDKNLDRFPFLTAEHKKAVLANPFISLLF